MSPTGAHKATTRLTHETGLGRVAVAAGMLVLAMSSGSGSRAGAGQETRFSLQVVPRLAGGVAAARGSADVLDDGARDVARAKSKLSRPPTQVALLDVHLVGRVEPAGSVEALR